MSGDALDRQDGESPRTDDVSMTTAEPLSWPLVERRHNPWSHSEPDRRVAPNVAGEVTEVETIGAAPLAPFRILALIGAFIRGYDRFEWRMWDLATCIVIVVGYTAFAIWKPIRYTNDSSSRVRTVIEAAIITGVVVVSGAWSSPFVFCLVPTAMLAAFVGGTALSAQLLGAAAALTTLEHLRDAGVRHGLRDATLWLALLAFVIVTSGQAYRVTQRASNDRLAALDRVGHLAEANALLFSLQRVAQTLPASLDLRDVLDAIVARVKALLDHRSLTILLVSDIPGCFAVARSTPHVLSSTVRTHHLPTPLGEALRSPRPVRVDDAEADGDPQVTAPGSRSGLYVALRARGALIGLIAVESDEPNHFGAQQVEVLHGLADPFGIAIDNARLFQRLRTVSVDEERNRIARDLHDQIGSSLAYLGFEIDRSIAADRRGEPIDRALRELRGEVTRMVGEVRETLYDLRSDVSESQDLHETLRQFIERVHGRSGLTIAFTSDQQMRLSIAEEREFWNIAREALINVERHAQATHANVDWVSTASRATLVVSDNGIGLQSGSGRVDSYGMRGMRERAASIGAELTTESSANGTVIRVALRQPKGVRPWE